MNNLLWSEKGDDWMAIAISMENDVWVFVSVYVAQENRTKNERFYDSLTQLLINRIRGNENVVICGDMKAHLHHFDNY